MQNNTFSRLFVGQKIVRLSRIDSTNSYLKNELSNSAPLPEGTVILAEEQYAGRGQETASWVSEAGKNLTFSVLLQPVFLQPTKQFILNKALSLALYDVLFPLIGDNLKIKWPNDLYVNNEKLGGMLIENTIRGLKWKYAIAGIGINVNQVSFPESIQNVTSLCKILHKEYALNTLLEELCTSIEFRYRQLGEEKYAQLDDSYLRCLYRLDMPALYRVNGRIVSGIIKNVDENGRLQLQLDNGLYSFGLKEITYVIP